MLLWLAAAFPAGAGTGRVVVVGESPEAATRFEAELEAAVPGTTVERVASPAQVGAADLVLALGEAALLDTVQANTGVPVLAGLVPHTPRLDELALPAVVSEVSAETQIALVRRLLPEAKTLGVVYAEDPNQRRAQELAAVAASFDLKVEARRLATARDLPAALSELGREVDVLIGLPDAVAFSPSTLKALVLFSFRNRIPLVGPTPEWVDAGALYAPVVSEQALGAQCAGVAARILAGKPTDRITPPSGVGFALNERTARQLGVRWSEDILGEAVDVP